MPVHLTCSTCKRELPYCTGHGDDYRDLTLALQRIKELTRENDRLKGVLEITVRTLGKVAYMSLRT